MSILYEIKRELSTIGTVVWIIAPIWIVWEFNRRAALWEEIAPTRPHLAQTTRLMGYGLAVAAFLAIGAVLVAFGEFGN